MKHLILVSSIVLVIILIFLCRQHGKKRFDTQTTFKEIDYEHQEMADTLDKFLYLAQAHWRTEERLYNEGKMRVPPGHKDVQSLWADHHDQHMKFIDRIKQMKVDLAEHIVKYDIPHFHYGPD